MKPYAPYTEYSDEDMMNGFDDLVDDLQKEIGSFYMKAFHDSEQIKNFIDITQLKTHKQIEAIKMFNIVGDRYASCCYYVNGGKEFFMLTIDGGLMFFRVGEKYYSKDLGIKPVEPKLDAYGKMMLNKLLKDCRLMGKEFTYFEKRIDKNGDAEILAVCKDGTKIRAWVHKLSQFRTMFINRHYTKKELGL